MNYRRLLRNYLVYYGIRNKETSLLSSKKQLLLRLMKEGFNKNMLDVFGQVPREVFVDISRIDSANDNAAQAILPDGSSTISQPTVVALMLSIMSNKIYTNRTSLQILEIGTGSGYNSALILTMLKNQYVRYSNIDTVDISDRAIDLAINNLSHLFATIVLPVSKKTNLRAVVRDESLNNVLSIYKGDARKTMKEKAIQYDFILSTASVDKIHPIFLKSLAKKGTLIVPVLIDETHEHLVSIERIKGRGKNVSSLEKSIASLITKNSATVVSFEGETYRIVKYLNTRFLAIRSSS